MTASHSNKRHVFKVEEYAEPGDFSLKAKVAQRNEPKVEITYSDSAGSKKGRMVVVPSHLLQQGEEALVEELEILNSQFLTQARLVKETLEQYHHISKGEHGAQIMKGGNAQAFRNLRKYLLENLVDEYADHLKALFEGSKNFDEMKNVDMPFTMTRAKALSEIRLQIEAHGALMTYGFDSMEKELTRHRREFSDECERIEAFLREQNDKRHATMNSLELKEKRKQEQVLFTKAKGALDAMLDGMDEAWFKAGSIIRKQHYIAKQDSTELLKDLQDKIEAAGNAYREFKFTAGYLPLREEFQRSSSEPVANRDTFDVIEDILKYTNISASLFQNPVQLRKSLFEQRSGVERT